MCVPLITEGYCETKARLVDKHNSTKDLKAFLVMSFTGLKAKWEVSMCTAGGV